MTEKKRLSKKEKKEILESLMGFYQVILSIFGEGCNKFEDEKLSALIIKAHIFEIINFQSQRATNKKLPIPEMTEIYSEYIDTWNAHILAKEPDMKKIIKDYLTSGRVSYIS